MPIPGASIQTNRMSATPLPSGYEASFGLTMRTAIRAGLQDSPLYALGRVWDIEKAAGDRVTGMEHIWDKRRNPSFLYAGERIDPLRELPEGEDPGQYISKDEAKSSLTLYGIDEKTQNKLLGQSELFHRDTFYAILSAQKEQRDRDMVLAHGGSGLIRTPAVFAAQMVGSMGDPVNIAASMLPVGRLVKALQIADRSRRGIGMSAQAIKRASSWERAGIEMMRPLQGKGAFGRFGVRFRQGALDGFVGGAITEPATMAAYRAEGSEYGMGDLALGLALGIGLGGGLGAGMGSLSDGLRRIRGIDVDLEVKQFDAEQKLIVLEEQQTKVDQALKQMSRRDREAVITMAADDLANGRRVDISDVWMSARKAAGLTEDDPHIFLAANGGLVVKGQKFNSVDEFIDHIVELDADGLEKLGFYSGGLPDKLRNAESRDVQLKHLTNYVRKMDQKAGRKLGETHEDFIDWINRTGGLDEQGRKKANGDGVIEPGQRTLKQLQEEAREAGYGEFNLGKKNRELRSAVAAKRNGVNSYKADDAALMDQQTRDIKQLYQMLQDIDNPPKIKDEQSFRAWMDTKSDNPKNSIFYDPDAEAKYMESIKEDLTYSPEDAAKAKKLLDDLTATMASVDPEAAKIIRDQSTVISQEAANTAQYTTDLVQCLIGTLADA